MPIRFLVPDIIKIGTGFFVLLASGHYDLPDRNAVPITTALTTAVTSTTSTTTVTPETKEIQAGFNPDEQYFNANTVSVSSIKLKWNIGDIEDYSLCLTQLVPDDYIDNVYFDFRDDNICYVNGLREGTEYQFDILDADENVLATTTGKTETVEVVYEFEHEDGWTNCFAYENAKGLTKNPSWSAIQGAEVDKVTNTGIMRDEYGDYCCAMGTFYGYCGDRFLISLENGTQFTVKICDSKGDRRYHDFGNSGKCIVEFIHGNGFLPACVAVSGNYGLYNWNGLDLGADIESIKMINYGDTVEY